MSSNSQRIEVATRGHISAVLTNEMLKELVKVSDPSWTGGIYPSDAAYKRGEDGVLAPRGRTAYGDGILEYLGPNSFKVLADNEIVRMPRKRTPKAATPAVETPAAPVVATPEPAQKKAKKKSKKKASRAA
jgi:hypothetical protein